MFNSSFHNRRHIMMQHGEGGLWQGFEKKFAAVRGRDRFFKKKEICNIAFYDYC